MPEEQSNCHCCVQKEFNAINKLIIDTSFNSLNTRRACCLQNSCEWKTMEDPNCVKIEQIQLRLFIHGIENP